MISLPEVKSGSVEQATAVRSKMEHMVENPYGDSVCVVTPRAKRGRLKVLCC